MKYDFSTPLTEEQMKVVEWVQANGDDVIKASAEFNMDPDDIFYWTIQDYELRRRPLMQQGFKEMTGDLLKEINSIYEKEVNLRKIWEDDKKAKQDAEFDRKHGKAQA